MFSAEVCVYEDGPPLRPDWYDYRSWLLGIVGTVYAADAICRVTRNPVGKISLLVGLCVGIPLWLGLWHPLSLVAGSLAAAVVDAGYRLLSHSDQGVRRSVRRDCGGCVAAAPMWIVAIAGVLAGLALVYWRS